MDVNMVIKQNITKITWYSIRYIPLQLNEVVSLSKAGIYILYYLEKHFVSVKSQIMTKCIL